MVGFNENGVIKDKKYFIDYIMRSNKYQLIIVIIHNECIFFVNDGIQRL